MELGLFETGCPVEMSERLGVKGSFHVSWGDHGSWLIGVVNWVILYIQNIHSKKESFLG